MIEEHPDRTIQGVLNGVSVNWLKVVFGLQIDVCRARLSGCPVLRTTRGGGRLYDVATAAQYLVNPKLELGSYLKSLKPADLPTNLQASMWDARLKRQKWERYAGDLWPTDRVLDVLTDVFTTMRTTMQLWVDDLDRHGLTDKQREHLVARVDSLQNDIYAVLVRDAASRSTRGQLADLDEIDEIPKEDEIVDGRDWI